MAAAATGPTPASEELRLSEGHVGHRASPSRELSQVTRRPPLLCANAKQTSGGGRDLSMGCDEKQRAVRLQSQSGLARTRGPRGGWEPARPRQRHPQCGVLPTKPEPWAGTLFLRVHVGEALERAASGWPSRVASFGLLT